MIEFFIDKNRIIIFSFIYRYKFDSSTLSDPRDSVDRQVKKYAVWSEDKRDLPLILEIVWQEMFSIFSLLRLLCTYQ